MVELSLVNFPLTLQRAKEGDAPSQWITFLCYYWGTGTPKNVKEAVRWIQLSAQQGHVESQYNLALLHLEGEHVEQNNKEYLRWVTLAANQGCHYAQASLGAALQLGRDGVPKDEKEALKFLTLAANQENAGAQYRLGAYHYQHGHLSEAKRYFSLSSAGGNTDATEALLTFYNPKSNSPRTFSSLHSHILVWTYDVANHYCDTCKQSSKKTNYFRCSGCDFDLCVPCFLMKDTCQDKRLYDSCSRFMKFIPSVLLLIIVDYVGLEKVNESNWNVLKSHVPQGVPVPKERFYLVDMVNNLFFNKKVLYKVNQDVWGYSPEGWMLGKVCTLREKFVQVEYYQNQKHYQWFRDDAIELKQFEPQSPI
jgi:hypothetical protein